MTTKQDGEDMDNDQNGVVKYGTIPSPSHEMSNSAGKEYVKQKGFQYKQSKNDLRYSIGQQSYSLVEADGFLACSVNNCMIIKMMPLSCSPISHIGRNGTKDA